jgi:signal transduction histidine kinase
MRRLRLRLYFIVVLVLTSIGYFSFKAYELRKVATQAQYNAVASLELRSLALTIAMNYSNTPATPLDLSIQERLSNWRRGITSAPRRGPVVDLLQALGMNDAAWIKKRALLLAEQEQKIYIEFAEESLKTWSALEKHVIFALLSAIIGFFTLNWTVSLRILRPLDRLSRRMMDFLVDRYSFQFSQPQANELGDLQRTFNSLAQRVINTMDELKSLDQAKSEFLNIASHELRTPLTSIKGSLSLLDSGVMGHIDPNCLRLIKIAEVETDRLIRLINDLLDLAKIEAGKLPLACSWMPWDELVSKTIEGMTGLAHSAGINVKVEPSPTLEVFMDRDRIQQVLTNLVSNAIKFSPPGSWVTIGVTRTKQGQLVVNVRDQGQGISSADMAMIFQKFRQGATPDNPLVKGTGLGLAIAKALVTEHGGDIGVESELGEGAVFWFTLPKWRDDDSSSDDPSGGPSGGPSDGSSNSPRSNASTKPNSKPRAA